MAKLHSQQTGVMDLLATITHDGEIPESISDWSRLEPAAGPDIRERIGPSPAEIEDAVDICAAVQGRESCDPGSRRSLGCCASESLSQLHTGAWLDRSGVVRPKRVKQLGSPEIASWRERKFVTDPRKFLGRAGFGHTTPSYDF